MKPVYVIIIAILFGGASFFGGMKYSESQRNNRANGARQFQNGAFPSGRGVRGGNGGPVTGEIVSSDDKSITVKIQDGSSKIVILSETTTYNKTSEGSKTDLAVGARVGVFGMTNPDGSVTAQNVQLNPMMRNLINSQSPEPSSK